MIEIMTILLVLVALLLVHMLMVITQPSNGVIVQGNPMVDHRKVETATNVIPGRLAKKGTADHQIVVCGASDNPVGWVGYEYEHASYQPADRTTAYAADDMAPVYYGGGFVVLASIASGNNVTKGMRLKPAANGQLAIATTALTIASGSTNVTSTKANGSGIISGDAAGIIVGIAMESVNASAAAKNCAVLSLI